MTAIAFNSPKQLKKWKWKSSDEAGTKHKRRGTEQVIDSLKDFGSQILKVNVDSAKRNANKAVEFARITGRTILLMNPEGFLFTEEGQLTSYANDGTAIIVHVDYDGNFI